MGEGVEWGNGRWGRGWSGGIGKWGRGKVSIFEHKMINKCQLLTIAPEYAG